MDSIEDKVQVRVINKTDEMFDFIGDVAWIYSDGKVCVYFDDLAVHLTYDESDLEVVRK
jgi:hypothetical protein